MSTEDTQLIRKIINLNASLQNETNKDFIQKLREELGDFFTSKRKKRN